MSNTFITTTVIAKTALAVLYNNAVLAGLVWRDFDSDFTGKQGAAVTIKTPAQLTASDFVRGTGIQTQNVTEGSSTATNERGAAQRTSERPRDAEYGGRA